MRRDDRDARQVAALGRCCLLHRLRLRRGFGACDIGAVVGLVRASAEESSKQTAGPLGRAAGAGQFDVGGAGALACLVGGQSLFIARQRTAVARHVQRLAVREQADQFLAADARPVAHIADIHVDEWRARSRVVADAAALHLEPDVAQFLQRHAGDVEVHRLAEHVLAFLGDTAAAAAQHRVGGRRAIAADDLDVVRRTALMIRFPHQIEQPRIHLGRLVAAPVAQDDVDLAQTFRIVAAVALVDDLGLFVRVQVLFRKRLRFM